MNSGNVSSRLLERLKSRILDVPVTPLIRLEGDIFLKLESCQKTGSVKDRFVFEEVKRAVLLGEITDDTVLVEATSGNTGISLASAGASLGLRVKIVMPCNMSEERKETMRRFGAEVIEVGPSDFAEAIRVRNDMVSSGHNSWSPMQFENGRNIEFHASCTGPEISRQMLKQFAIIDWDFLSGAGTGGTLMGVKKHLDYRNFSMVRDHRTVQVAPAEDAATHGIQGINDGQNFLLDPSSLHGCVKVTTPDSIETAKDTASRYGLFVGISSGANISAARRYALDNPGRPIVTLACDRGERYTSVI